VCQRVYPKPEERWESVLYPSLGFIIERVIRETEDRIYYDIQFAEGAHKGKYADLTDVYAASWWIYLMATADIEHALRREAEERLQRPILVSVDASAEQPAAMEFAVEFWQHLQGGAKRSQQAEHRIAVSKLPGHLSGLVETD
jgi:hypothetical protein